MKMLSYDVKIIDVQKEDDIGFGESVKTATPWLISISEDQLLLVVTKNWFYLSLEETLWMKKLEITLLM